MLELPDHLEGAVCELRSKKNDLIFLGRIKRCTDETITVGELHDGAVPPVIFNTEFKVLLRPGGGQAPLALAGSICGSTRRLWKLDRLRMLRAEERRTAFRQRLRSAARVRSLGSLYRPDQGLVLAGPPLRPDLACRVVDISLGGLQVQAAAPFQGGEWLLLWDLAPLHGAAPFTLPCQVRWADHLDARSFTYGCHFGPMLERERDRLCQVILELQRRDIQAHKSQDV